MTRQEVERVDDRGLAAWDNHNPDAFVELLADNFVWNDTAVATPMRGRDEARQYMQAWVTAFPDMRMRRTNRLIDGDAVGCEIEFTGTNTGPMRMGDQEIPATGRTVHSHGTYFAKVSDGKIVEFHTHPDVAELMQQLGLMPSS
jgi:steroid delta-isomerase-like uncharacterized protein